MGINSLSDIRSLQLQHETAIGRKKEGQDDFSRLLQSELDKSEVRFSKHAKERMSQRQVEVSDSLIESLNQAVVQARQKGARDVAVIGAQGAFIVNVPNNTVITTMSGAEMKNNIFTNIDSAVLI